VTQTNATHRYGAVAIGRNEGERLKRCLLSMPESALTVYVDSGSTDGSVEWARSRGFEVVELDISDGFTAARARNAGFNRLKEFIPDLSFVQFIDGDCEIADEWPARAIAYLEANAGVCAVFGRRRERHPEHSVYNWLCDQEWNTPIGAAAACGGDVMMRADALAQAGGYRDDMIAGEEPELCVRLRAAGWSIWRVDGEMTLHDANISHFSQWWRRMVRSGYAFAQGSYLHRTRQEQLWVWESRRAWIWGVWLPLGAVAATAWLGILGLVVLLVYPLQLFRQLLRGSGRFDKRMKIALFQSLARFPESIGQLTFLRDRFAGWRGRIVEYK
jgi:GT2 family glycosyltransferase